MRRSTSHSFDFVCVEYALGYLIADELPRQAVLFVRTLDNHFLFTKTAIKLISLLLRYQHVRLTREHAPWICERIDASQGIHPYEPFILIAKHTEALRDINRARNAIGRMQDPYLLAEGLLSLFPITNNSSDIARIRRIAKGLIDSQPLLGYKLAKALTVQTRSEHDFNLLCVATAAIQHDQTLKQHVAASLDGITDIVFQNVNREVSENVAKNIGSAVIRAFIQQALSLQTTRRLPKNALQ